MLALVSAYKCMDSNVYDQQGHVAMQSKYVRYRLTCHWHHIKCNIVSFRNDSARWQKGDPAVQCHYSTNLQYTFILYCNRLVERGRTVHTLYFQIFCKKKWQSADQMKTFISVNICYLNIASWLHYYLGIYPVYSTLQVLAQQKLLKPVVRITWK